MYNPTLRRQAFRLGLLVTLVVLALSACGGSGGGGGGGEEQAKAEGRAEQDKGTLKKKKGALKDLLK